MKIDLDDIPSMPHDRIRTIRSLFSLHEFRNLYDQFKEAETETSIPESTVSNLRADCMKCMIRVLLEEFPPRYDTERFSRREVNLFLHDLKNFGYNTTEDDFPSLPGTEWNWPPSPDFSDYVDHMIYKLTTDLVELHV